MHRRVRVREGHVEEERHRRRLRRDELARARRVPRVQKEGVERLLDDWSWISLFFNRVNTAMGKNPLYPFTIPPPVVTKLDFVHRVVRASARERRAG